jgi:hypothetical protein
MIVKINVHNDKIKGEKKSTKKYEGQMKSIKYSRKK